MLFLKKIMENSSKIRKSKKWIPFWTILFTIIYLSFCGNDKAETIEISKSFSQDDIYKIIKYARSNHIDPDRIHQNLSYVRATEKALQSLPHSLLLFSKEYYKNRSKWREKDDPPIPGKALFLKKDKPYLIFIPNYKKLDKMNKKAKAKRKKENKKLTRTKRRERAFEQRNKDKKLHRLKLLAWQKNKFSKNDFQYVLAWIEQNWRKYKNVPAVYKEKKKAKQKREFGLHLTYFAAANGFLRSMDPHCSVIPRSSWKKTLSKSEDSSFEGIGALLRGGGSVDVVVETPLPGSPALRSGLRSGDIIREVDGVSIEDMLLSEVVKKIRGPRETIVTLNVERTIDLRTLDVKIKRGIIKQLAVQSHLVTAKETSVKLLKKLKIGVIQIKSFLYAKKKTNQLVVDSYKELLKKSNLKLDALIIDLRNNPGGYLRESVRVADLFLASNKVVVSVKGQGRTQKHKTRKSAMVKNIPLVVLINSGSASASEILASALMDHNAALVLGERTFGKATVQSVNPSYAETYVKITTSRYYSPNDYTVQVSGVHPDIKISDESDGTFPLKFREENMWDHLPRIKKIKANNRRRRWIQKINKFVGKNTVAEEYIKKHKSDALRPDYMLIRSLAYIKAMLKNPKP